MDSKSVRVRFAPSPTGRMHLGSARTALYDYLLARRTGGQFVLRIEDTDFNRFVPGAEQELIDGLHWLGLQWDEGPDIGGPCAPYRQSERKDIYLEYARKLIELDSAYPCFCSKERLERIRQEQMGRKEQLHYDGTCRLLAQDDSTHRISEDEPYVIRFKTPKEGSVTVRDLLRGEITVEKSTIDDFVLLKSDGLPTYHLAAIVDDHLMNISHVIRGAEWLPTFPLHSLIIRAFGWEEPVWIHLSVFLKPTGKGKMSKRDVAHAMDSGYSIYITDLLKLGYVPEAVLNWIVLMGWGVPEDDLLTLDEMIARFEVAHLTPSPAAINFSKLDHFNGAHIRSLTTEDLASRIKPYFIAAGYTVDDNRLFQIVPLIRERLVVLDDCLSFAGFFFKENIEPVPEELIGKDLSAAESLDVARQAFRILENLSEITAESTEAPLRELVNRLGLSANQVFGILRVAVTGQKVSPPLFESMAVIGKEQVLARIQKAMVILEEL